MGKRRQVKPLLDISFPLDWEDSENENETSLGDVDILSMEKAQQACAVAVQGSGSLPNDTDDVETPFEKRIVTLIYKRKFSKVPFEKADAPLRKSFSESLFSKITLKRVRFSNKNKRVVVGCVL